MTPSEALAGVVVDELARAGVRHVVLCPGSRSAPLAYALLAADRAGLLRLHVRVDERSAAFLALGLSRGSGHPAAVVTTSGTAVANLHPAVLEAHEAGVPLLLLTADRPPELRGTRANQTTDQLKIFGDAVRFFQDLGVPEHRAGQQAGWRATIDRAVAAARGTLGGDPGPVHLNLPLRDPLAPTFPSSLEAGSLPGGEREPQEAVGESGWPEPLAGRPDGRPWTQVLSADGTLGVAGAAPAPGAALMSVLTSALTSEPRTLVILGDLVDPVGGADRTGPVGGADRTGPVGGPDPDERLGSVSRQVLAVARHQGWPVVAEPFGTGEREQVLPAGPLLTAVPDLVQQAPPRRVLLVGRVTLSRATAGLLRLPGVRVEAVADRARWTDPGHVLAAVYPWSALLAAEWSPVPGAVAADAAAADAAWAARWRTAGAAIHEAVRTELSGPWPSPTEADEASPGLSQELRGDLGRESRSEAGSTVGPGPTGSTERAPSKTDPDLRPEAGPGPGGPQLAHAVLDALADVPNAWLFVGPSNIARDIDLARGSRGPVVLGNRGLAGIDGCLSTAAGIALAHGPGYALVGDLTFLHDANGLLIGPTEQLPDLTIVVADDEGGGIFATLEYGEPTRRAADDTGFARIFTTPTDTDLAALCAAHRVGYERITDRDRLGAALCATPSGIRVLHVPIRPDSQREDHTRLRDLAVRAARAAPASRR